MLDFQTTGDIRRTRVKICGVRRVIDAVDAARAGADAVGLVFHRPSARHVPLPIAAWIRRALPPFVTPVALFVDAPVEEIVETVRTLAIRDVQLHGHEEPAVVEAVGAQTGAAVLKVIRVEPNGFLAELDRWREAIKRMTYPPRGLVLETAGGAVPGGAGIPNDWSTIARARDAGAFAHLPPLIVAGGLTPESVADVIRQVRPWAVDVSSGVERSKGVKSLPRMRAFIRAAEDARR